MLNKRLSINCPLPVNEEDVKTIGQRELCKYYPMTVGLEKGVVALASRTLPAGIRVKAGVGASRFGKYTSRRGMFAPKWTFIGKHSAIGGRIVSVVSSNPSVLKVKVLPRPERWSGSYNAIMLSTLMPGESTVTIQFEMPKENGSKGKVVEDSIIFEVE